jgi:hypothetical protein
MGEVDLRCYTSKRHGEWKAMIWRATFNSVAMFWERLVERFYLFI